MENSLAGYQFIVRTFNVNGIDYKACLLPELYNEDDGLDFTGSYLVTLISERRGTSQFMIVPKMDTESDNPHNQWEFEPEEINTDVLPALTEIIHEIRVGGK